MPRTLVAATLGLALMTLTACQQGGGHGGGGARPAPPLADAFARTYGTRVANAFPSDQRAAVAQCVGQAMANGIPLNDQFLIYDALESGQSTSASQAALQRWVGGPVLHGPIMGGYNKKHTYADGTEIGGSASARIESNLQQTCALYKDRLMKAGYLAAPSGGGANGGYSKGK